MQFNFPRWFLCSVIGFIFVAVFEYVVHGILLVDLYAETPDLWRTMESMEMTRPYMVAIQYMMVAALSYVFTLNYEGKGLAEGWRFGVIFGVVFAIASAAAYAWMPISPDLTLYWSVSSFVKLIGLGFIFVLLYKPDTSS